MNKDKAYKTALALVAEVYDKTYSQQGRAALWEFIKDFTAREIIIAFKSHIKDPERGRWTPKPADLHYQVEKLRESDFREAQRLFHKALAAGNTKGEMIEFDGSSFGLTGKHRCEHRLLLKYLKEQIAENGIDESKLLEVKQ